MTGYWPIDAEVLLAVLAVLLATFAAGYGVTGLRPDVARLAAWAITTAAVVGLERLTADQPAGFRMVILVCGLLYGMKAVVCVEAQAAGGPRLTLRQYLGFVLLWFGMRPSIFSDASATPCDGAEELLRHGRRRLVLGIVLTAAAWWAWNSRLSAEPLLRLVDHSTAFSLSVREALTTVLLLVGLSLILHFGVFNLLAAAWRKRGVDCRPLFRAPLVSKTLGEFWSRRWNLGFTEMTSLAVFRPLRKRLGDRGAAFIAFLFSGLLHELAISVPVQAGFGLPLLYFALHGAATTIERRLDRAGHSLAERPWLGWSWTMAWIVLPLPLLFHRPFLRGCFWPLIGAS